MEELTKLQNDYLYFEKMYNKIEKMKKMTNYPGNGFAKMKCKERMDELL